MLNKTWFVLNLLLDVTNIFIDTGYSDRGPQGGSRPSNDRWDSRSNRGNYGQFNDETGGNREWSRSASTRTYSNKPPLRATPPDRKPFPDESFQKDAPPPGMQIWHSIHMPQILYYIYLKQILLHLYYFYLIIFNDYFRHFWKETFGAETKNC